MQALLFMVMLLQLGGVPDPKGGPASWIFYMAWIGLTLEQWMSSGMAAVSNILALAAFERQAQDCLTRLPSGTAYINAVLPVLVFHPALLTQVG